jgi:hypothetical protein
MSAKFKKYKNVKKMSDNIVRPLKTEIIAMLETISRCWQHRLVSLSRAYLKPPSCAYGLEGAYDLGPFIRNEVGVVDIPFLRLPNLALPRILTIKRNSFCY